MRNTTDELVRINTDRMKGLDWKNGDDCLTKFLDVWYGMMTTYLTLTWFAVASVWKTVEVLWKLCTILKRFFS